MSGCGGKPVTSVVLAVTFDQNDLTQLEVSAMLAGPMAGRVPESAGALLTSPTRVVVILDDALAGAPILFNVQGLVAGLPVADGSGTVTPVLRASVTLPIMLSGGPPGDSGLDSGLDASLPGNDAGDAGTDALVMTTDSAPSLCLNGTIDSASGEQCDPTAMPPVPAGISCSTVGGACTFSGGTLACSTSCFFDPSACTPTCGDGITDVTCFEQCDGADLDGESCTTQGFTGGMLDCTPGCMFDTTGCT
jgi:hypothetical protein